MGYYCKFSIKTLFTISARIYLLYSTTQQMATENPQNCRKHQILTMVFTSSSTHLSLRRSLSSTQGLNPFKTLLNQVGSIFVAGSPIKLQTSIKSLGVHLDSRLSSDKQLSETCKASYFHIHTFCHIRSSLTTEAAKKVVSDHGLIIAMLSSLAHLFTIWPASSLFRIPLHALWTKRLTLIISRLFCLSYVLSESDFPFGYAPVRSIRSSSSWSICVPLRKTSMATSRSFSSVALKIWNALPGHLSSITTLPSFRRCLKHHLVLRAHPGSRTPGGITPSERITLPDTTPPAAIGPLENTMSPAKRVPSECLRLAKVIKTTYRLHFGARVNTALLIYLLTTWTIIV